MSLFTVEEYYTHATKNEDHGNREDEPEISVIGKNYTQIERGKIEMS